MPASPTVEHRADCEPKLGMFPLPVVLIVISQPLIDLTTPVAPIFPLLPLPIQSVENLNWMTTNTMMR
jgi:hypothetical protein